MSRWLYKYDDKQCPLKTATSACPSVITPFEPVPKKREKLEKWLLDALSSSAFNACSYQELPAMTGEPMKITLKADAESSTNQSLFRFISKNLIIKILIVTWEWVCCKKSPKVMLPHIIAKQYLLKKLIGNLVTPFIIRTSMKQHSEIITTHPVSTVSEGTFKTVLDAKNEFKNSRKYYDFITKMGEYQ